MLPKRLVFLILSVLLVIAALTACAAQGGPALPYEDAEGNVYAMYEDSPVTDTDKAAAERDSLQKAIERGLTAHEDVETAVVRIDNMPGDGEATEAAVEVVCKAGKTLDAEEREAVINVVLSSLAGATEESVTFTFN